MSETSLTSIDSNFEPMFVSSPSCRDRKARNNSRSPRKSRRDVFGRRRDYRADLQSPLTYKPADRHEARPSKSDIDRSPRIKCVQTKPTIVPTALEDETSSDDNSPVSQNDLSDSLYTRRLKAKLNANKKMESKRDQYKEISVKHFGEMSKQDTNSQTEISSDNTNEKNERSKAVIENGADLSKLLPLDSSQKKTVKSEIKIKTRVQTSVSDNKREDQNRQLYKKKSESKDSLKNSKEKDCGRRNNKGIDEESEKRKTERKMDERLSSSNRDEKDTKLHEQKSKSKESDKKRERRDEQIGKTDKKRDNRSHHKDNDREKAKCKDQTREHKPSDRSSHKHKKTEDKYEAVNTDKDGDSYKEGRKSTPSKSFDLRDRLKQRRLLSATTLQSNIDMSESAHEAAKSSVNNLGGGGKTSINANDSKKTASEKENKSIERKALKKQDKDTLKEEMEFLNELKIAVAKEKTKERQQSEQVSSDTVKKMVLNENLPKGSVRKVVTYSDYDITSVPSESVLATKTPTTYTNSGHVTSSDESSCTNIPDVDISHCDNGFPVEKWATEVANPCGNDFVLTDEPAVDFKTAFKQQQRCDTVKDERQRKLLSESDSVKIDCLESKEDNDNELQENSPSKVTSSNLGISPRRSGRLRNKIYTKEKPQKPLPVFEAGSDVSFHDNADVAMKETDIVDQTLKTPSNDYKQNPVLRRVVSQTILSVTSVEKSDGVTYTVETNDENIEMECSACPADTQDKKHACNKANCRIKISHLHPRSPLKLGKTLTDTNEFSNQMHCFTSVNEDFAGETNSGIGEQKNAANSYIEASNNSDVNDSEEKEKNAKNIVDNRNQTAEECPNVKTFTEKKPNSEAKHVDDLSVSNQNLEGLKMKTTCSNAIRDTNTFASEEEKREVSFSSFPKSCNNDNDTDAEFTGNCNPAFVSEDSSSSCTRSDTNSTDSESSSSSDTESDGDITVSKGTTNGGNVQVSPCARENLKDVKCASIETNVLAKSKDAQSCTKVDEECKEQGEDCFTKIETCKDSLDGSTKSAVGICTNENMGTLTNCKKQTSVSKKCTLTDRNVLQNVVEQKSNKTLSTAAWVYNSIQETQDICSGVDRFVSPKSSLAAEDQLGSTCFESPKDNVPVVPNKTDRSPLLVRLLSAVQIELAQKNTLVKESPCANHNETEILCHSTVEMGGRNLEVIEHSEELAECAEKMDVSEKEADVDSGIKHVPRNDTLTGMDSNELVKSAADVSCADSNDESDTSSEYSSSFTGSSSSRSSSICSSRSFSRSSSDSFSPSGSYSSSGSYMSSRSSSRSSESSSSSYTSSFSSSCCSKCSKHEHDRKSEIKDKNSQAQNMSPHNENSDSVKNKRDNSENSSELLRKSSSPCNEVMSENLIEKQVAVNMNTKKNVNACPKSLVKSKGVENIPDSDVFNIETPVVVLDSTGKQPHVKVVLSPMKHSCSPSASKLSVATESNSYFIVDEALSFLGETKIDSESQEESVAGNQETSNRQTGSKIIKKTNDRPLQNRASAVGQTQNLSSITKEENQKGKRANSIEVIEQSTTVHKNVEASSVSQIIKKSMDHNEPEINEIDSLKNGCTQERQKGGINCVKDNGYNVGDLNKSSENDSVTEIKRRSPRLKSKRSSEFTCNTEISTTNKSPKKQLHDDKENNYSKTTDTPDLIHAPLRRSPRKSIQHKELSTQKAARTSVGKVGANKLEDSVSKKHTDKNSNEPKGKLLVKIIQNKDRKTNKKDMLVKTSKEKTCENDYFRDTAKILTEKIIKLKAEQFLLKDILQTKEAVNTLAGSAQAAHTSESLETSRVGQKGTKQLKTKEVNSEVMLTDFERALNSSSKYTKTSLTSSSAVLKNFTIPKLKKSVKGSSKTHTKKCISDSNNTVEQQKSIIDSFKPDQESYQTHRNNSADIGENSTRQHRHREKPKRDKASENVSCSKGEKVKESDKKISNNRTRYFKEQENSSQTNKRSKNKSKRNETNTEKTKVTIVKDSHGSDVRKSYRAQHGHKKENKESAGMKEKSQHISDKSTYSGVDSESDNDALVKAIFGSSDSSSSDTYHVPGSKRPGKKCTISEGEPSKTKSKKNCNEQAVVDSTANVENFGSKIVSSDKSKRKQDELEESLAYSKQEMSTKHTDTPKAENAKSCLNKKRRSQDIPESVSRIQRDENCLENPMKTDIKSPLKPDLISPTGRSKNRKHDAMPVLLLDENTMDRVDYNDDIVTDTHLNSKSSLEKDVSSNQDAQALSDSEVSIIARRNSQKGRNSVSSDSTEEGELVSDCEENALETSEVMQVSPKKHVLKNPKISPIKFPVNFHSGSESETLEKETFALKYIKPNLKKVDKKRIDTDLSCDFHVVENYKKASKQFRNSDIDHISPNRPRQMTEKKRFQRPRHRSRSVSCSPYRRRRSRSKSVKRKQRQSHSLSPECSGTKSRIYRRDNERFRHRDKSRSRERRKLSSSRRHDRRERRHSKRDRRHSERSRSWSKSDSDAPSRRRQIKTKKKGRDDREGNSRTRYCSTSDGDRDTRPSRSSRSAEKNRQSKSGKARKLDCTKESNTGDSFTKDSSNRHSDRRNSKHSSRETSNTKSCENRTKRRRHRSLSVSDTESSCDKVQRRKRQKNAYSSEKET